MIVNHRTTIAVFLLATGSAFAQTAPDASSQVVPDFTAAESNVRVESSPSGASVFVNERPAGQTPLLLPADGIERVLRVELQGYQRVILPMRSSGAGSLLIVLQKNSAPAQRPPEGASRPTAVASSGVDVGAFGLSLLFPGLGQASQDRSGAAVGFGIPAALAIASYLWAQSTLHSGLGNYERSLRDRFLFANLANGLPVTSIGAISRTTLVNYIGYPVVLQPHPYPGGSPHCDREIPGCREVFIGHRAKHNALWVYSIVWLWSAFDALFHGGGAAAAIGEHSDAAVDGGFSFYAAPEIQRSVVRGVEASAAWRLSF